MTHSPVSPPDGVSVSDPLPRPPLRCLITGATGFIGAHLGRVLVRAGWRVAALARATSDRSGLAGLPVEWVAGDVTDPASLREAVENRDAVFHCAGLTKALDPADLVRVNGGGAENLLRVCAAARRPPGRVVVLSSQAAGGPVLPDGRPRTETDPCEPVSDYGRSKLAGERACAQWAGRLPVVVLRPVAVYGPGERDFFTLFQGLARVPVLVEAGSRPVVFQAMHSSDLVRAMIAAARVEARRVVGQTFYVGHPRAWDSDAFGRLIGRAVGRRRVWVVRVPWGVARATARASETLAAWRGRASILNSDKIQEMAASPWVCSMDAFHRATGFAPRIDAPEGLRAAARWYRRAGWL